MSSDEDIAETLSMIDKIQLQIPEDLQCPGCGEEHQLINCQIFRQLEVSSRISLISPLGICLICLEKHEGLCSLQTCGVMGCKASHHPLLHSEELGAIPRKRRQSYPGSVDVANIERSRLKKRFACVPFEQARQYLVQYPPQGEKGRCALGDGPKHKLSHCLVFREFNIVQREMIVRQYDVCIKCLDHDHKTSECFKLQRLCGFKDCQLQHHYLLHRIPFIVEEGLQEAQEAHDRAASIHQFKEVLPNYQRWCSLCKVLGHFPDKCTEWFKKPSKRIQQAQLEKICIHCLMYISDSEHDCHSQEVICGKSFCSETHHHLFHTEPKGRSPNLLQQSVEIEKWKPDHNLRIQGPDNSIEYQLVVRAVEGKPEPCVILKEEDFMSLAQGQPNLAAMRSYMFPVVKGTLEKLGAVYKGALYRKFCIDFVAKHGHEQVHVKQDDETNDTYVIRQALFAIRKEENRTELRTSRE